MPNREIKSPTQVAEVAVAGAGRWLTAIVLVAMGDDTQGTARQFREIHLPQGSDELRS